MLIFSRWSFRNHSITTLDKLIINWRRVHVSTICYHSEWSTFWFIYILFVTTIINSHQLLFLTIRSRRSRWWRFRRNDTSLLKIFQLNYILFVICLRSPFVLLNILCMIRNMLLLFLNRILSNCNVIWWRICRMFCGDGCVW